MRLIPYGGGGTSMVGTLRDQSEQHGIIERIRDLNLSLVTLLVKEI